MGESSGCQAANVLLLPFSMSCCMLQSGVCSAALVCIDLDDSQQTFSSPMQLNLHLLMRNAGDMGHLVPAAHDSHQLPSSAHHEQAAHTLPG